MRPSRSWLRTTCSISVATTSSSSSTQSSSSTSVSSTRTASRLSSTPCTTGTRWCPTRFTSKRWSTTTSSLSSTPLWWPSTASAALWSRSPSRSLDGWEPFRTLRTLLRIWTPALHPAALHTSSAMNWPSDYALRLPVGEMFRLPSCTWPSSLSKKAGRCGTSLWTPTGSASQWSPTAHLKTWQVRPNGFSPVNIFKSTSLTKCMRRLLKKKSIFYLALTEFPVREMQIYEPLHHGLIQPSVPGSREGRPGIYLRDVQKQMVVSFWGSVSRRSSAESKDKQTGEGPLVYRRRSKV